MQDKIRFLTGNSGENNAMLLCFSAHQLFNQKPEKKSLCRMEYLTMKMCRVVAAQ